MKQLRNIGGQMTSIIEALKSDHLPNLRLTVGRKWMVWSYCGKVWIVYYKGFYQRHTRTLIETPIEADAIRCLLAEEA